MNKLFFLILLLFSTALYTTAQNNWNNLSGPLGGSIEYMQYVASENRVYAMSSGNIYFSTDNGTNWGKLNSSGIYFHSSFLIENDKIYAGNYNNLYLSEDNGESWTQLSIPQVNSAPRKIFRSPQGTNLFVVFENSVIYSADDGLTWENITPATFGDSWENFSFRSNGDLFFANRTLGVYRHLAPSGAGTWSADNWELIFAKEYTDESADQVLSVIVSHLDKVLITHRKSTGENHMQSSATGNPGTFSDYPGLPDSHMHWLFWSRNDNKLFLCTRADGNKVYELIDGATPLWTERGSINLNFTAYWAQTLVWKNATEGFAGTDMDGVFYTNNGGASWTRANGTLPNAIMTMNTEQIFTAPGGVIFEIVGGDPKGYWYSNNGGDTWQFNYPKIASQDIPIQSNMVRLADNSFVYSSDNTGIVRSVDGLNWSTQSIRTFQRLVVFGSELYGFSNSAISRSTDAGLTWTDLTVVGLPASYDFHQKNHNRIAVDASGTFYISLYNTDQSTYQFWRMSGSGTNYAADPIFPPLDDNPQITGLFVLNNTLYISNPNDIAISANQGNSWSSLKLNNYRVMPIVNGAFSALAISTDNSLLVSQDIGKSWKTTAISGTSRTFITDIKVDANGNYVASTYNGPVVRFSNAQNLLVNPQDLPEFIDFNWQPLNGPYGGHISKLYKTSNNTLFAYEFWSGVSRLNTANNTWTKFNLNPNHHGFYIDAADKLYYANFCELYTSTDNGANFTLVNSTFNCGAEGIFAEASGNIYMFTNSGLLRSSDGGLNFNKPATANTGRFYDMVQAGSGELIASKEENGVHTVIRSTDNGLTWTVIPGIENEDPSGFGYKYLNLSNLESGAVAIATASNIYKSTDGGQNWSSIRGNLTMENSYNNGARVTVAPNNEYYLNYQASLYTSSDNGTTWTLVTHDFFINYLTWVGTKLYVATSDGVMESSDEGQNFTAISNGLVAWNYDVRSLLRTDGKTFASGRFVSDDEGASWSKEGQPGDMREFLTLSNGDIITYTWHAVYSLNKETFEWVQKETQIPGHGAERLSTVDGSKYFMVHQNDEIKIRTSADLINWEPVSADGLPAFHTRYLANDENDVIYLSIHNRDANNQDEVYRIQFGEATRLSQVERPENVIYHEGKIFIYDKVGKLFEFSGDTFSSKSVPSGESFMITGFGYYFIRASGANLWLSRDEGQNWQNVSNTATPIGFSDVLVDEENGRAYGAINGQVIYRSNNLVVPNDFTVPIVISDGLSPANGAINVPKADELVLSITFNEAVIPAVGKRLRLFNSSNASTPIAIFDAINGAKTNTTFSFSHTATVEAPINFGDTYFVTVENGAFTDIFGNAFAGITTNNAWRFTIQEEPDTQNPTIQFTASNRNNGAQTTFQLTAQDNRSIRTETARIFYRGISAVSTQNFQSSVLSVASGAGTPNVNFTVNAQDSWYDAMGMEFYFEIEDNAGNKTRSPEGENTYHYSYINFPSSNPLSVPSSAIGFGGSTATYKIIAIPHRLNNAQISTVLVPSLGSADKSRWRFATYVGGSNPWSEFDGTASGLNSIARGKGYWINVRNNESINIEAALTPDNHRNSFFKLTLQPGWNQIGNPYTVPISWNETRDAAGNASIGQLKRFNGISGYVNSDILDPFQGGFVFLQGNVSAEVVIRFIGIDSGGGRHDNYEFVGIGGEQWTLPIQIKQGEYHTELPGIGMRPEANEGLDVYDDINPPALNGLKVPIVHFSNIHETLSISRSIVNTQNNFTWDFTVNTSLDETTTISWPEDLGEGNMELFLLDRGEQRLIDMRTASSYFFNSGSSNQFRIFYGSNLDISPERIHIGKPYPNPSNSITDLKIQVSFPEMQSTAVLGLELYDQVGRAVTRMQQTISEKGFHEITWDLSHAELKGGVYYYQIKSVCNGEYNYSVGKMIFKH